MWRNRIARGGIDSSSALATKSFRLMACTMPRIILAVPGHPTVERITVMMAYDWPELRFVLRIDLRKRIR